VTGRSGTWTAGEDSKLKDAVQTHGDKDWVAIAALVRKNIVVRDGIVSWISRVSAGQQAKTAS
jgi:hypothetical protein